MLGTLASGMGGTFIGLSFYLMSLLFNFTYVPKIGFVYSYAHGKDQWPMIIVGTVFGFLGSLIDSLLGATLQVTYYDHEKKCIVKTFDPLKNKSHVELISGLDILSNEAVNFISIAISMSLSVLVCPLIIQLCL